MPLELPDEGARQRHLGAPHVDVVLEPEGEQVAPVIAGVREPADAALALVRVVQGRQQLPLGDLPELDFPIQGGGGHDSRRDQLHDLGDLLQVGLEDGGGLDFLVLRVEVAEVPGAQVAVDAGGDPHVVEGEVPDPGLEDVAFEGF